MFSGSKPVPFDPYGRRRKRRLLPAWLWLLLLGAVLGIAGVLYVQERYLPPRLSAADSSQLRSSFEKADTERKRLRVELTDTARRLDATLTEKRTLTEALATSREATAGLRQDIASVVSALPPDPRGGAVQVRAARFTSQPDTLTYDVLLSRERSTAKPLTGVLQLIVSGSAPLGKEERVVGKPIPMSIASHESVRGTLSLPNGYTAKQATINVLDGVDGKLLGMRVFNIR